jgi:hypothetical protein
MLDPDSPIDALASPLSSSLVPGKPGQGQEKRKDPDPPLQQRRPSPLAHLLAPFFVYFFFFPSVFLFPPKPSPAGATLLLYFVGLQ